MSDTTTGKVSHRYSKMLAFKCQAAVERSSMLISSFDPMHWNGKTSHYSVVLAKVGVSYGSCRALFNAIWYGYIRVLTEP